MSFCLIHNADLQKLEEIAVGRVENMTKYFDKLKNYVLDIYLKLMQLNNIWFIFAILEKLSVIPNKNIPQTIWRSPVFRKDQLSLKLFIVPLREVIIVEEYF